MPRGQESKLRKWHCERKTDLSGLVLPNPNRKSSQRYLKFWDEEEARAKAQRAPRFGKISKGLSLRAWRPFDFAQDMLGARTFLVITVGSINC